MTLNRSAFVASVAAAMAIALFLRGAALIERPMHADEANQAHRTATLTQTGIYRFDPTEHHGPSLYYAGAAALHLFGADTFAVSEAWMYRSVPLAAGLLTLLLLATFAQGLGSVSTSFALLLIAASPFQTYFGAYFIQEPLLLLFSTATLASAQRYSQTGNPRWLVILSLALGALIATKETFILLFAAAAVAAFAMYVLGRFYNEPPTARIPSPAAWAGIAAGAFGFAALWYASFGQNPAGPIDAVRSLFHFTGKGTDPATHRHAWHFYLGLLAWPRPAIGSPSWSEGLILLLGAVGLLRALRPGTTGLLRFLAFFGLLGMACYSAVPYKTPWNLLVPYTAWTMTAGAGASWIGERCRRWPLGALLLVLLAGGSGHLLWQSWLAGAVYPADPRNPYAYSATSPALTRLPDQLAELGVDQADTILVIAPEAGYWPLPWYLRRFTHTGYFDAIPPERGAAALILPNTWSPKLSEAFRRCYTHHYSALRPGALLSLWVRR